MSATFVGASTSRLGLSASIPASSTSSATMGPIVAQRAPIASTSALSSSTATEERRGRRGSSSRRAGNGKAVAASAVAPHAEEGAGRRVTVLEEDRTPPLELSSEPVWVSSDSESDEEDDELSALPAAAANVAVASTTTAAAPAGMPPTPPSLSPVLSPSTLLPFSAAYSKQPQQQQKRFSLPLQPIPTMKLPPPRTAAPNNGGSTIDGFGLLRRFSQTGVRPVAIKPLTPQTVNLPAAAPVEQARGRELAPPAVAQKTAPAAKRRAISPYGEKMIRGVPGGF